MPPEPRPPSFLSVVERLHDAARAGDRRRQIQLLGQLSTWRPNRLYDLACDAVTTALEGQSLTSRAGSGWGNDSPRHLFETVQDLAIALSEEITWYDLSEPDTWPVGSTLASLQALANVRTSLLQVFGLPPDADTVQILDALLPDDDEGGPPSDGGSVDEEQAPRRGETGGEYPPPASRTSEQPPRPGELPPWLCPERSEAWGRMAAAANDLLGALADEDPPDQDCDDDRGPQRPVPGETLRKVEEAVRALGPEAKSVRKK
jgi:hypothetical protein